MSKKVKICVERTLPNQIIPVKTASMSMNQFNKMRAAFYTDKLWTTGDTITITFMGSGDNIMRTSLYSIQNEGLPYDPLQETLDELSTIEAIITIVEKRIQPIVGLKFNFINDYNADIRISFEPTGAWSNIGTDCRRVPLGQATMNFGWLDVATVIHEFGHALGMIHEHQNPRGEPIEWNIPLVLEWAAGPPNNWSESQTRHNIINKYEENITNGSTFDPESIMLYYFPDFFTTNNRGTKQNQRLSKKDVIYLAQQYPGGELTPNEFYTSVYGESIDEENVDYTEDSGENVDYTEDSGDIIGSIFSKDKNKGILNFFSNNSEFIIISAIILGIIYFIRSRQN